MRAKREVAFLRTEHVFARVRAGIRAAQRADCRVVHFSVQGDHVHMLVEANDAAALRSGMQGMTTRLARAINKALRRRGKVWADRHHRRALTKPREVRNALAYVLLNHRKHGAAGVVVLRVFGAKEASLDPCSSSVYFDGWSSRSMPLVAALARGEDAALRPVPPPRTWLLREGWRKYGLVDPSEVPGSSGRAPGARFRHAKP